MHIVDFDHDLHENRDMFQRPNLFARMLELKIPQNPIKGSGAVFLFGPRQTGKTTLLRQKFATARCYDLLDSALSAELSLHGSVLREELLALRPKVVVIDEIQKVPSLLEEIHWLLENTSIQFVLCGSSARTLKKKARNLLGGRAVTFELLPLTSQEIPHLDLLRMLHHGALPVHYLADEPRPLLKAYVNSYIKEEVLDESLTRNVPAFVKFLEAVGWTHGQQLNYANIARECGVSSSTVRSYFEILQDTLLGFELPAWRKSKRRRLVETAKFYLFDTGVANYLHPEVKVFAEGTDVFGRSFEHFLLNEVRAYCLYNELDIPLSFWRTSSGFQVDLIIGPMEIAIEFKSSVQPRSLDFRGLRSLQEEHRVRKAFLVTRGDKTLKTQDGIDVVPWREFCSMLWGNEVL